MSRSGARGNTDQLTQMVGMRGLMAKTFDYGRKTKSLIIRDSIESPVISSFKSGMKISEFFNASYGARKAISDVQMKTSKSGYMTRKLVDVAQEVIVTEDDCGSYTGIVVTPIMNDDGQILESLSSRISGRYSVSDVVDNSGNVLVKGGELISEDIAEKIEKSGVESVEIRSILHCNCKHGVCRKCYGTDLTTGKDVNLYTPVGVVAAQSIGEPITQINLRSFHSGGVAGGPQIAQGYERIVQLLELIPPKDYETAIIAPISGKILSINDIKDEDSDLIKYKEVQIQNDIETVSVHVYHNAYMIVKVGQDVVIGDKLNSGSINLHDLLIIKGIETVKHYIINEVQKMYLYQGIKINDKYMEIIINQMTNRVCISNSGDSNLLIGDTITINQLSEINDELLSNHKNPANATPILISLPNIPAKSDSFLAAASFQYTKRVLISAAIRNQVDNLQTLKENVILGKLIPAGSGNAKPEEIIANGFRTRKDEY
jgi:DNA-directed RNA polymerase subunit beta'